MAPDCASHRPKGVLSTIFAANSDDHYDGIGDAMVMILVLLFVMMALVVVMMVATAIRMRTLTKMTIVMVVRDTCFCRAASVDDSHVHYRRALEHAPKFHRRAPSVLA